MIRAAKMRCLAAGLVHHRHRMVPADVEKRPQLAVAAAHHHYWLSGHARGDVLPGLRNLLCTPDRLPRP